jgi:septal ring factor EnvC (AmiA/AmiB activator)
MTSTADDLDRRATALERAQGETTETLRWVVTKLARIQAVQDEHTLRLERVEAKVDGLESKVDKLEVKVDALPRVMAEMIAASEKRLTAASAELVAASEKRLTEMIGASEQRLMAAIAARG